MFCRHKKILLHSLSSYWYGEEHHYTKYLMEELISAREKVPCIEKV